MGIEVVILIVLAAAFIIMKVIQGDSERKRRIERSERLLRDKAANRKVTTEKFDELWNLNLAIKESNGADEEELNALEKPDVDRIYQGMPVK